MRLLLQGLVGALLGAVLAMAIFYWVGSVSWPMAFIIMGICFVLGATMGEKFLEWLKELIERVW